MVINFMKKEKWISIYKGILIILMVLGHTTTIFGKYIYTFHIAAFFMISGYLFKDSTENFLSYLKRKFKSLMMPYFAYVLALTVIAMLFSSIFDCFYQNQIDASNLYLFAKHFSTVDLAGALWFLPVLFFTEIGYKLLFELLKSKKKLNGNINIVAFVICFIIAIWGYTYYNNSEILPYFLDLVMISLVLFSLGNLFKKIEYKITSFVSHIVFCVSCLGIYIYSSKYWQFINFPTRSFPNIIVLLLLSFFGFFIVSYISKLLSKSPINCNVLCYIGNHTMAILGLHFLGFRILFGILYICGFVDISQTLSLVPLYSSTFYGLLTTIFAIVFSLSIEFIYKKIVDLNWKNFINSKKKSYVYAITVAIVVFIFNLWIFNNKNFFVFDDFSHLKVVSNSSLSELLHFLPTAVYNSRPVGHVVMKLLVELFQYNFFGHAIFLLMIHVLNSVMVYFLSYKMFKFNKIQSLIISILFGVFPTSIMAFIWEAAIFDLVGCTITLLCLIVFYNMVSTDKKNMKIVYSVLLIVLYYLGLRTKEMLIALPCVMLVYCVWYDFFVKKMSIKDFVKKNSLVFVLIAIMLIYFIYTRVLNVNNAGTNEIDSPYYYTFSIYTMVVNLFRYIYLYFNLSSLSLSFTSSNSIFVYTSLFLILTFIYSIYLLCKKKPRLFYLGICFVVMILPVLPMKNMQHILYLYIPSIFMAMILINILENLKFKWTFKRVFIVIIILYFCVQSPGVLTFRNWWFSTTYMDKETYKYLEKLKDKYDGIETVNVINVDESSYHSYFYGPGAIVNVAFRNFDIVTKINPESYDIEDEKSIVIDCSKDCKVLDEDQNEKSK